MISKISTTREIEEKIIEMQNSLKFSSKAAIIRISLGLALSNSLYDGKEFITKGDFSEGASYSMVTIIGNRYSVFQYMLFEKYQKEFCEKELQTIIEYLIEMGVKYLYSKYRYYGNNDNLLKFLLGGK